MAAARLTDSQKQELAARYRQGETAQALATAFGCSPNTVSRVLKAAFDPEELAALKQQARTRSASPAPAPALAQPPEMTDEALSDQPSELLEPAAELELAIDDADDFGDDGLEDADDEGDDAAEAPVITAMAAAGDALQPQPLQPGALPGSVYLLVDKTVELQARPLRDFPELGSLPVEEQEQQALMLFTNPRQAKRQCGRSQRVIKVPDAALLERRASYLVAQGITRLVLEGGSLYSLPGA